MNGKIKIVADSNIPFLQGVFEPYAEIVYKDGLLIDRDDVRDADAVIIRTRTKCDEGLLGGSSGYSPRFSFAFRALSGHGMSH